MEPEQLAMFIKGGGSLLSYFLENQPIKLTETKVTETAQTITVTAEKPQEKKVTGVSTEDTINYQKREISKELLLMEKHLQQGCKINGVACDCCTKHPMAIEALSQEALGMTGDKVYSDLASWSKEIMPLTSEEASASGKYEDKYPQMAVEAREMRKKIMGTTDVMVLLDPAVQQKVKDALKAA